MGKHFIVCNVCARDKSAGRQTGQAKSHRRTSPRREKSNGGRAHQFLRCVGPLWSDLRRAIKEKERVAVAAEKALQIQPNESGGPKTEK